MDEYVYLEVIDRESARFAAAVAPDPKRPVPTCPGWTLADLMVHLGIIQRWAAEMVRIRAQEALREREQRFGVEPGDPGLIEWFRSGTSELLTVLGACPPEVPVWSWTPHGTARFWRRRQAHEVTIHRWDAEHATGGATPIEPLLAADGIDEWLSAFAIARSRARSTRRGNGESFHFHCTDAAGEWTVVFEGDGIDVRGEHAKADLAVRGRAAELLLFLWGRREASDLDVYGDLDRLDDWKELLPSI